MVDGLSRERCLTDEYLQPADRNPVSNSLHKSRCECDHRRYGIPYRLPAVAGTIAVGVKSGAKSDRKYVWVS